MPEGPEILWCATYYKNKLLGKYITIYDNNILGRLDYENGKLVSGKVIDVNCKGKYWWICLDNKIIYIHFYLHGWVYDNINDINKQHIIRYSLKYDDDSYVYFVDKTNNMVLSVNNNDSIEDSINKLGMSIYNENFTFNIFKKHIKSKKCILANYLLNQQYFCGIGNYIKNEAIYLSKLKVKVKTNELSDGDIKKLYDNIMFVAYSKYAILAKDIVNKWILKDIPIDLNYEYKIYKRKYTDENEKVIKLKISGRDTYTTEKYL